MRTWRSQRDDYYAPAVTIMKMSNVYAIVDDDGYVADHVDQHDDDD